MKTVTEQNRGAKGLKVIGVAVTALVIGAWILPSGAQMERVPVGPVHAPAEIVPDANADGALSIDINFPAVVQDGQYCVAYGIASGGTAPYEFSWGGELSDADAEDGPLGPNQIASGYVSAPGELELWVTDADSESTSITLEYIEQDEYNPDCEA